MRLAAARDDVDTLDLLAHVPDFDVDASHDGFTPLLAAAVEGHARAAAWLLRRGARLEALKADGWGDTALHYAAARGSLEIVKVCYGHEAAGLLHRCWRCLVHRCCCCLVHRCCRCLLPAAQVLAQ